MQTPLCKQHWRMAHVGSSRDEMWAICGLTLHANLAPTAVEKLETLLLRGPNLVSDKGGHLYQFVHAQDHPNLSKLGYTHRTPEKRLAEWPGAKLRDSWPMPVAAHFAESVCHLLMDHWRVYRFIFTDRITGARHALSVWKQTLCCLDDAEYQAVSNVSYVGFKLRAYARNLKVRRGLRSIETWCPAGIAAVIQAHDVNKPPGTVTALSPKGKGKNVPMEKEWFCINSDYLAHVVHDVHAMLTGATNWHAKLLFIPPRPLAPTSTAQKLPRTKKQSQGIAQSDKAAQ